MTEVNRFESIIVVKEEEAKEMQEILNIEEGHAEDYDEDGTIATYSTEFNTPFGRYGVDIKVCNGDTPYIDPVLFHINTNENGRDVWIEIGPLDVCETLLGEYEFETEVNGQTISLVATVVTDKERMKEVKEEMAKIDQEVKQINGWTD